MTTREVLHCDLNNFYASCEVASNPELKGKPVAVSGNPEKRHGIILAKSELAKKAGAKYAATGENPVVVACRKADVIIGPVGIVITDSLLGEITEKMALAISRSNAVRILIPINKCDNIIAGISNTNISALIEDAIYKLEYVLKNNNS